MDETKYNRLKEDPSQLQKFGNEVMKEINDNDKKLTKKADLVNGKVPESQLPDYVDDVVEYPTFADFPTKGEAGKLYVDVSTNSIYRWNGTRYAQIGGKVTAADVDSGQAAANLVLVSDGHGGASWQQVPGIGEINTAIDDINGEVI